MIYRSKLESEAGIQLSGSSCVICGWCKLNKNGNTLVEGAHVKPLECDLNTDIRQNIIALCPNHHVMFDNYLFYIHPQTKVAIFVDKDDEYNQIDLSSKVSHIKPEYLAYRQYLFEKHNLTRIFL